MTALADVLAGLQRIEGGYLGAIPPSWAQGRTAYGGLSAALALHAAHHVELDLPPLRSALIAFVGPLSGEVEITAHCLRRGRHAAYVEARVTAGGKVGLTATFVFMADLPSTIAYDAGERSPHRPPLAGAKLYRGSEDHFTGNFEFKDAKDATGAAEWLRWVRLAERTTGVHPEVALLAIGDALPPAAYKLRTGEAAISSLTWMVNVLCPDLTTTDGWWLSSSQSGRAVAGHSSQAMTLWNADGVPVVQAMQAVALFT